MASHTVVSHEEWLAARRERLENEKTFSRQCDEMSLLQRSLPWEAVTKEYRFDGPDGRKRSETCLPGAVSWLSTTSCSIPTTKPAVRTARCAQTASQASACT